MVDASFGDARTGDDERDAMAAFIQRRFRAAEDALCPDRVAERVALASFQAAVFVALQRERKRQGESEARSETSARDDERKEVLNADTFACPNEPARRCLSRR